jgi:amino acid transporter
MLTSNSATYGLPWRLFRTVVPAVIALSASSLVYVGFGLLLVSLTPKTVSCSELAAFLCVSVGILVSGAAALATILTVEYLLLRKRVRRPWLLLVLANIVSSWLLVVVLAHFPLPIPYALAAMVLIYVGSNAFFDWYLNRLPRSTTLKIVTILGVGVGSGLILNVPMVPGSSAKGVRLKQELQRAGHVYLVPPPNSSYPQPITIAAESDENANPDYRIGAYFGIDTGAGNGTTLYEYNYTNADPIKDCAGIPKGLLPYSETGETSCSLATTRPSGTGIYAAGYTVFVIKNQTVAVYEAPSDWSKEQTYDFMDHLQPWHLDTLLKTLHKKNPSEY